MGYPPSLCLAALLFLNIVTTNGLPATTVQTTNLMGTTTGNRTTTVQSTGLTGPTTGRPTTTVQSTGLTSPTTGRPTTTVQSTGLTSTTTGRPTTTVQSTGLTSTTSGSPTSTVQSTVFTGTTTGRPTTTIQTTGLTSTTTGRPTTTVQSTGLTSTTTGRPTTTVQSTGLTSTTSGSPTSTVQSTVFTGTTTGRPTTTVQTTGLTSTTTGRPTTTVQSTGLTSPTTGSPTTTVQSTVFTDTTTGRPTTTDQSTVFTACSALNCTAREECKARSGIYGCACANNNPRFNAATFDAYNYCNSSSGVLSLSRCELFEAGFPSDFLHLNDPSCGGDIQDDRVVFTFDNRFRICGTTMKSNATHLIYENTVRMAEGVYSGSVISRDSWLDVKFSCVYPLIQSISMSMSIYSKESVVSKILPGTESAYQLRLVTYPNSSFITPYSGNITIEVNQQVFIAVEADGIDSSQFATVLDSCWATPYNDINYPVRWDLIINECPNEKDGTVEVLQNGIWTASHFSFRMFTFTNLSNSIFLHCQVHLCPRMSGQCSQPCNKNDDDDKFRGRRRRSVDFHDKASISMSF
ncbi:pancreatic secretory granule membrane major glycoprotein GP2 isoform X6 [Astyanax mexicanus]|uniref:pancreatic secretory granule membrane major glycoprotein GP2 isoform X6 n=1 Tax=Astyanax mexicanus TaxID=7994 RepID=UPI0020CACDA8|nr:pancreatic secretory granule membrane major glycoprotein GP2 isoform X6 [Astyanax mexicanus]